MSDITGAQTRVGTGSDYGANQVVAMFESYAKAATARDALENAGIARSRIEILDQSGAATDTTFSYERHEEGMWGAIKSLFMPDEDAHLYAEGVRRGYAMLLVRAGGGDYDRVLSLLEAQNPVDVDTHASEWRQGGWSGVYAGQAAWESTRAISPAATSPGAAVNTAMGTSGTSTTTSTATGMAHGREEVIPVYEEQLRVGKREVGRGSVRVRSFVVETPVQEQVRLHEERVEVERRPVDRVVSGTAATPFQERTIEVTATGEEAVIAKETRLKEEIVVRKQEEERTQTVSDTVRHTEVEVEDDRVRSQPAVAPTPTIKPTP